MNPTETQESDRYRNTSPGQCYTEEGADYRLRYQAENFFNFADSAVAPALGRAFPDGIYVTLVSRDSEREDVSKEVERPSDLGEALRELDSLFEGFGQ